MKRKKMFIILSVLLVIAITVVVAITQLTKWSRVSFEAVVQETVIQPDGEVRLIVKRTTEVYSDPLNSLHIDENTALIGNDSETISIEELQPGYRIKVILEDSFIDESPFYYRTVYGIKMIDENE